VIGCGSHRYHAKPKKWVRAGGDFSGTVTHGPKAMDGKSVVRTTSGSGKAKRRHPFEVGKRIIGISSCLVFMSVNGCDRHSSENTENLRVAKHPSRLFVKEAAVRLPPQPTVARHDTKMQELTFAWKPSSGPLNAYEMTDPRDQHQILLSPNLENTRIKPVILFHGQPRRGSRPRDYEFPRVVVKTVQQMLDHREIEPLILIIPKFRFEGENWPKFYLDEFLVQVNDQLSSKGIVLERPYVVGHSGAAGCGGAGLNFVAKVEPSAVGFFDTCIGPGFIDSVTELLRKRIPTLIVHSVETAGYRPKQRTEYLSSFDFGKVYRKVGLSPSACPNQLPDVPLRELEARCSTDETQNTLALVVDTGEGEAAHNAVVPVALRYFLRRYLKSVP
jgi:hypothetical protein